MESIAGFKNGFFTGNLALGYYPDSGRITYEGNSERMTTNHLATIMGGFELVNELLPTLECEPKATEIISRFRQKWLDFGQRYKRLAREIRNSHFPVRRLMSYAAWQERSPERANEAWHDLWGRIEHDEAPQFSIERILPPGVPSPIDEWHGLSTNDAALWSLDAIYMQEVLP
jgi:hypothetical protein